jgi:butyryl-CoA dehydrogenase
MKGNFERFLADATIFMEMTSTVIIAWQWITMAANAKQALVTGQMAQSQNFYDAQIHTMKFYFKYELPKINGHIETLLSDEVLTIVEEEKAVEAFS